MKKSITIIACVLTVVITALATALMIIQFDKNKAVAVSASQPSSESSKQEISLPEPTAVLTIIAPQSDNFTTTDQSVTFTGVYLKDSVISLNGKEVKTDQNGAFCVTESLQYGNNSFSFSVDGQSKLFNIQRRYIVISSYSPKTAQTYSAGVSFPVSITARQGIKPTATFNGKTITLSPANDGKNGFCSYNGKFTLPTGHFRDLDLGKVTFKAEHNGFSEAFYSANIICKKEDVVVDYDPNATPKDSNYINVGSGVVTEIIGYQAETFSAGTNTDKSIPQNNYLPKGTVDYGSPNSTTIRRDGENYKLITLRCGKTVYESMRDKPSKNQTAIAKQYVGTLPDHNEVLYKSIESSGSHTLLKLGVDWKAPFYFDILPQSYNADYSVSNVTFNYVDITFCYATVFEGEIAIPQDNPLFSSAKLIKNNYDYTLRLYLKKQGGFYGWDSYYDSQGDLCFQFLNPARITQDLSNPYGVNLSGVKILIDVGHGGIDGGSVHGRDNANCEANRNLILANKLKNELASMGATVYLTRTDNSLSTADSKLILLKKLKPDFCLALHHDSNKATYLNGIGSYYFTPFSKKAAEFILNHSFNTGIYKKKAFKIHKYFTLRNTVCPVVLTENGYMSNDYDFSHIINDASNTQKAKALAKGIAEYFQSIQ